ncbi:MAG: rod shape-determining protein MreD [Pseudomonadota bacterium]|nr:rod shape-determining protein MreD [Gammaproteobacteria bacterium]MBU1732163.1 rod shape-determining protein MreD [Gammaproteobacteria bacterium]MBU1893307.1 rod shape-determining protein MreD [Gammaproteobacteria bacterium]
MTDAPTLTRPPSGQFIAMTLFAAIMLDILPWQGTWLLLRPDFVLLLLLYWAIHQPLRIGMATAWGLGLVMDVADGALLGQYALAYTFAIYLALTLHRRIQAFGLWPQAWHIFPLLLVSQILALLTHLLSGATFIGWGYFLASITGALFWPPLSLLVQLALKHRYLPDVAYTTSRGSEK